MAVILVCGSGKYVNEASKMIVEDYEEKAFNRKNKVKGRAVACRCQDPAILGLAQHYK